MLLLELAIVFDPNVVRVDGQQATHIEGVIGQLAVHGSVLEHQAQ